MRNVIILGSGRSGTSMVAGLLANSGYFMGDALLDPDEKNPKGYFEDRGVNMINEDILQRYALRRPRIPLIGKVFFRDRPLRFQRWLSVVPEGSVVTATPQQRQRMLPLLQREPFCFKDPRFCHTLPAWRPLLNNVAYLCVFRHPATTADSMLKVWRSDPALHSMRLTFDGAMDVWTSMYRNVLTKHAGDGDWAFLHYDQMFTEEGARRIETLLDCSVDRKFPDRKLTRSSPSGRTVGPEVRALYQRLCKLAGFDSDL